MSELICTARRTGDFQNIENRTEEYELTFAVADAERSLSVRYLASRAYEINESLDACVEEIQALLSEANLKSPPAGELSRFSFRAMQASKYGEGQPETSTLDL